MPVLPGKGSESEPMESPTVSRNQQYEPEARGAKAAHRRGGEGKKRKLTVQETGKGARKGQSLGEDLDGDLSVDKKAVQSMTNFRYRSKLFTLSWKSHKQNNGRNTDKVHGQQKGMRGYSHPPARTLPFSQFPKAGKAVFFLAFSPYLLPDLDESDRS